ncbi:MAG TPA: hypothetical protein VLM38_03585 [Blastocatellia bacterium]|nr:hypothetical protein [Blastocatellia bacterium]
MTRALVTLTVLAHFVIVVLHGRAHTKLGIELSTWQTGYVVLVIVLMPLAAAMLVWTRHARLGLVLLAVSMAGSLVFGVYFHYLAVSMDHVSHLPPGDSQGLFRLTAMLLAGMEAVGLAVGIAGLIGSAARTQSQR